MSQKTCSACRLEKSREEFQVRRASKDGLTSACKQCLSSRDAARYQHEAVRRAERHAEYMKTPAGRDAHARAARKWRGDHPGRRAAQVALGNAVRDGRMHPQPRHECGATAEAHHPDYSRPLDVVWLCPAHHKQAHALGNRIMKGKQ